MFNLYLEQLYFENDGKDMEISFCNAWNNEANKYPNLKNIAIIAVQNLRNKIKKKSKAIHIGGSQAKTDIKIDKYRISMKLGPTQTLTGSRTYELFLEDLEYDNNKIYNKIKDLNEEEIKIFFENDLEFKLLTIFDLLTGNNKFDSNDNRFAEYLLIINKKDGRIFFDKITLNFINTIIQDIQFRFIKKSLTADFKHRRRFNEFVTNNSDIKIKTKITIEIIGLDQALDNLIED